MIIKRYRLSYNVVTCDVDQLYIENLVSLIWKKEKKTDKGKFRRSTATKHHIQYFFRFCVVNSLSKKQSVNGVPTR